MRQQTHEMKKPITISVLWALLNIALFGAMIIIDKQNFPDLLYRAVRVLFLVSLIMQILVAFGWVKLEIR